MKKTIKHLTLPLLGALTIISGCKKDFDLPPIKEIPEGKKITIEQLKRKYIDNNYKTYRFTDTAEYSVYAVVTADESTGNLYKEAYIEDATGGLHLELLYSGGLYIGDSIRIYLPGTRITYSNGMYHLDSVDVDKNIIKQAAGLKPVPAKVKITDLDSSWQARLVEIDSVQFVCTERGETFADGDNLISFNRHIEDCAGNQVIVRNSGYASFANEPLPDGNGKFIGVFGIYNTDKQLYVRTPDELDMNGQRCGTCPYLIKDFDDNSITSGGWKEFNVVGNVNWTIFTGNSPVASISNYNNGTNTACETWLVSPAVDLSAANTPLFSFDNAYKYTGPALQVYISTDYDGSSDPTQQGTWTELTSQANWSSGNFTFVNSGNIDISNYKSSATYVAFKYTGTSSSGSTWELDNIKIQE